LKELSDVRVERRLMVYNVRKLHWPRMSDAFLTDNVDTTLASRAEHQLRCSVNCRIS